MGGDFDRWGIRKLRALAALPEVPSSSAWGSREFVCKSWRGAQPLADLRLLEPQLDFCRKRGSGISHRAAGAAGIFAEPHAGASVRALAGARACCAGTETQVGTRGRTARRLRVVSFEISLTIALHSTPTFIRTLRLPTPMLDAEVFLKLLQLDLQAHPPGAPIVKIHLSAEPARPRALQSGLFQPVFPEPEKLELTLARIAGIVGEGRVGSVELLDSHREGAFAVRHFAPLRRRAGQQNRRAIDKKRETHAKLCSFSRKYSARS